MSPTNHRYHARLVKLNKSPNADTPQVRGHQSYKAAQPMKHERRLGTRTSLRRHCRFSLSSDSWTAFLLRSFAAYGFRPSTRLSMLSPCRTCLTFMNPAFSSPALTSAKVYVSPPCLLTSILIANTAPAVGFVRDSSMM